MKKYTLTAEKRTLIGRKVKNLRKDGLLPATVYGKKIASVTLSVGADDFAKVYKSAGETGLIDLTIAGSVHPVLIHTVQRDVMTRSPLHVEFLQVDLAEKVKTKVPLAFVGIAPAVAQRLGVLLTVLDEVDVEALPAELPDHIDVDLSSLAAVNQELTISDVKAPAGVTILSDPALTLVKIGSLVSKEAEAQAVAEAAAAAAAPPTGGEGAATAGTGTETAKPAEAGKTEEAKAPEK